MLASERQIPTIGCWLLVLVRLAIGWHLLYEGLWKLQTQHTSTPWSAEGYLKNATGPFRDRFRDMTGDPNDLNWLNYDLMAAKWDNWQQRFNDHYFPARDASEANQATRAKLDEMLHGSATYSVKLDALPEGVKEVITKVKIDQEDHPVLWYDKEQKRLVVDGKLHLLPNERDNAAKQAPEDAKYVKALDDLFKQQSKLSYQERLAAMLKGDPDRIGVLLKDSEGQVMENRMGDVDNYKALIGRYEKRLAETKQAFQWNHLERLWRELQDKRRQLVGPVIALENDLKQEAEKLLTAQQAAYGPVPEPLTPIRRLNLQTMWGLTIIGGLLIAGLFTRLALLAGSGLLMMFYLAAPPWPGTPPEVGPEHNYIVNKVLIESLALLAFATLPSGRWFGIDALLAALFRSGRKAA